MKDFEKLEMEELEKELSIEEIEIRQEMSVLYTAEEQECCANRCPSGGK